MTVSDILRRHQPLRPNRDLVERALYRVWAIGHRSEPWMDPGAVRLLDLAIDRDGNALEWGSGRSTRWFASRVAHLSSVEHDSAWMDHVSMDLSDVNNLDLIYERIGEDDRGNDPLTDCNRPYVKVAERFADESLALVIVDGLFRAPCVEAALPKVAPWGLLVVDDTARCPFGLLGIPPSWPIVYHGEFLTKATTIWSKPGPS